MRLDNNKKGTTYTKLERDLRRNVISQHEPIQRILDTYQTWEAGLSSAEHPVGIFLFVGPTGSGKTKLVEELANSLHGSTQNILKIDCGEYQMEHEVAKLVGAPPGYLGHRETHPILSQSKISSVASANCNLSIILFDEIEKAAPSMARLLLGVFDKGKLRLGDNNMVNFTNSIIFLTSNLGSSGMMRAGRELGLGNTIKDPANLETLKKITHKAITSNFSPEFYNRIDSVETFDFLSHDDLCKILELELNKIKERMFKCKIPFFIEFHSDSKNYLIKNGTSREYGARYLKRLLNRKVVQKLSNFVSSKQIEEGDTVFTSYDPVDDELVFIKDNSVQIVRSSTELSLAAGEKLPDNNEQLVVATKRKRKTPEKES